MSCSRAVKISWIAAVIVLGAACGGTGDSDVTPAPPPAPVVEASPVDLPVGSWVATSIDGDAVPEGVEVTLSLDAEGRATGSTGCNRFSGTWTFEGASVATGPMATTRMACPPPASEVETAFERAAAEVATFSLEDGRLMLKDAGGAVRLAFERAETGAAGT